MLEAFSLEADNASDELSRVLIHLLKGIVYRDEQEALWQSLLKRQSQVKEYIQVLGLALVIFEDEGFAWLKTRETESAGEEENALPKLVSRRPLSYALSVLLALLRKQLLLFDAQSGEGRLVLRFDEMVELMQAYLPSGTNEVKWRDQIAVQVQKAVEMGFLKKLKTTVEKQEAQYEVRRILIAFIDAQWLGEFEMRLQAYRDYAQGGELLDSGTEESV
ncbi:hypothetical protein THMIRHAS_08030 [Thiosulfatimonas sediminis]|uniref:DUF4194 domain-containing protein n=1 Tax=Thiosulfatimonas sediminis TaxID=2675054 RepID=A0A6F8PTX7_9GAMM|nr:DUF4194 domain-containing protein [Thiosulfatimonas sediminis]BBP45430.1 hypothetical protein THMIRHAS_08030 [Thiosulfatimonas sediminis]